MKIPLTCLMLLALCVSPCEIAGQEGSKQQKIPLSIDKKLESKVDTYLKAAVGYGIYSGVVLIVRDGKVVVRNAYGHANFEDKKPFDIQTKTKLMSVSKVFTATAIAKLAHEGKLKTSDPVSIHLPNFPTAWRKVTIRQLLSHSSEIPNCESAWTTLETEKGGRGIELWPELSKRLADRKLDMRVTYSNFNYILLGLVIEKVSGLDWPRYVQKSVFAPAGMADTGVDNGSRFAGLAMGYFLGESGRLKKSYQDMSRIQAAGGVFSNVDDLYRFDRALHTDQILPEAARTKMFKPVTKFTSEGWSLLPVVAGHRCVSHAGGANGYVADFLRFPDDNACVIVTSNLAFAPIGAISRDLAAMLFDQPVKPFIGYSEKFTQDCAGVYVVEFGNGQQHRVLIRNNKKLLIGFQLHEQQARAGGRILLSRGDNEFEFPYTGWRLRFDGPTKGDGVDVFVKVGGGKWRKAKREPDLNRKWQRTIGNYQSDAGERAVIKSNGESLTVTETGLYNRPLRLIPLSDTKALALYNELGGNIISRNVGADADVMEFAIEFRSALGNRKFERK